MTIQNKKKEYANNSPLKDQEDDHTTKVSEEIMKTSLALILCYMAQLCALPQQDTVTMTTNSEGDSQESKNTLTEKMEEGGEKGGGGSSKDKNEIIKRKRVLW